MGSSKHFSLESFPKHALNDIIKVVPTSVSVKKECVKGYCRIFPNKYSPFKYFIASAFNITSKIVDRLNPLDFTGSGLLCHGILDMFKGKSDFPIYISMLGVTFHVAFASATNHEPLFSRI